MGNFDGLVCGHKRTLLIGLPMVGACSHQACLPKWQDEQFEIGADAANIPLHIQCLELALRISVIGP